MLCLVFFFFFSSSDKFSDLVMMFYLFIFEFSSTWNKERGKEEGRGQTEARSSKLVSEFPVQVMGPGSHHQLSLKVR